MTGGYYDSGDNVKFGLPMAFTVTMLAWSVVEHEAPLAAAGELRNALAAVRWGADYLARAHAAAETLYVQVGDGDSDHSCWQRPEDMDTPRTAYSVDASRPGSDVAAETAAALAAASVAFRQLDAAYSAMLLGHAEQLFSFAKNHRGLYQNSVPGAAKFYASSGDEMLWAAVWLFIATGGEDYKAFIAGDGNVGGAQTFFSWDNKFVGAQALLVLQGKLADAGNAAALKSQLEQFLCGVLQHNASDGRLSPGGVLWLEPWNNLQFVTSAAFVVAAHSDHLAGAAASSLRCGAATLPPSQLLAFARSQADYILGANPERMSYMVGYGARFPEQVHHRGASVPSIKSSPGKITCKGGFAYYSRDTPNPNVLVGAIVGGPDGNDRYDDSRPNYKQTEPSTVTVAPMVGVLARLSKQN
uniref:Endoglucanase n=1 Tax=Zea mays TaxID=4577 RepID=M1S0V0_MAIZE|nr:cellulase [Zea mays]